MVALNFKSQFTDAVASGAKRQTIRARRKDGRDPKPGDALQLYNGMRQKSCRKLADAKCTNVCPIKITDGGITIAGEYLDLVNSIAFARADGFETYSDMIKFFSEQHGLPFEGLLIEWR